MTEDGSSRQSFSVTLHSPKRASQALELPVDPARTYTWVPAEVAAALGLERVGTCAILTDRGRVITRSLAQVTAEHGGVRRAVTVVVAEDGDLAAVGVTTLEAFGLVFNDQLNELRPVDLLALET